MTMHWIAGQTLSSNSQYVFENIPETFTHLQIRGSLRANYGVALGALYTSVYRAGGTGYSFSNHALRGDGSSVTATSLTGNPYLYLGGIMPGTSSGSTSNYGSFIMDVLDYSNPSKHKTIKLIAGSDINGSGSVALFSGRIGTLDIMNSMFFDTDGNLGAGSRIDIYGITSNPVATGA